MSQSGTNQERSARENRRRKAMAILAGGLVLGVGAVITLAAWNDSELVAGAFGSGSLDLQGSTDGSVFTSDDSAPGRELSFELNADSLSPGDSVSAPFAIRLSGDSTSGADIVVASSSDDPIAANLSYRLIDTGAFVGDCDAATPGTSLVADAAANAGGTASLFSLAPGEAPKNLCFVVTAGPGLAQNLTGSVTWEFTATSTESLSQD